MNNIFEDIKHINEDGIEYWSARELSKVLEYKDYRNFAIAIDKAMDACKNSGFKISDHIGEATDMVEIGSKALRAVQNYRLSRYSSVTYYCL